MGERRQAMAQLSGLEVNRCNLTEENVEEFNEMFDDLGDEVEEGDANNKRY